MILRRTELGEGYVLLVLVLLVLGTWGLLRLCASDWAIRKAFLAASIAYFLFVIAFGVIDFGTFQMLSWEDHLIEWLSAGALFIACVLATVFLVRRVRRRRPCPLTALLAAGLGCACMRELAWGRPFLGQRLWYSRNLLRLQAYLDPAYFQEFRKSQGLVEEAATLYSAHLVFSGLFVLVALVVIVYVVRHRKRFLRQVREFPARAYGRYFLLGFGGYVTAQVLGELFEIICESEAVRHWHAAQGVLGNRVVDEPIELWGAACLLMSMITLWRARLLPSDATASERKGD